MNTDREITSHGAWNKNTAFKETSSWNWPCKIAWESLSWSFSLSLLSSLECGKGLSVHGQTMLTISNSPDSLLSGELSVDKKSLGDIIRCLKTFLQYILCHWALGQVSTAVHEGRRKRYAIYYITTKLVTSLLGHKYVKFSLLWAAKKVLFPIFPEIWLHINFKLNIILFGCLSLYYMHSHGILLSIIILLDVSQGEPGEVGLQGPGGAQGPPASTLFCNNLSLCDKYM